MDGVFSWEAAWPLKGGFGGSQPGDIYPDLPVIGAAKAHGKGYMIGENGSGHCNASLLTRSQH